MYEIHFHDSNRLAFLRFHGAVKGAEVQRAVTVAGAESGGKLTRVLLDYRDVSAMDVTETDGAMARINTQRLRATGVNTEELQMAWVTDPMNTLVNAVLYERIQRTMAHRLREGLVGFDSAERSLDEALTSLGLPSDFELPY